MSILFTPYALGNIKIDNRFIFSACEDNLADDNGMVTDALIRKTRRLARGGVGLIISSHMSVHPLGRTKKTQWGIFSDDMIPGLKKLVESVHQEGGKIVFQLGHAGQQITIRQALMGSSCDNPMNEDSILETVQAFRLAAGRAVEAGADGIQLHAAHGYLINQFLSPFFNRRQDHWGGSEENCFRLLKEIIIATRSALPEGMPLLVKLNSNDYTPVQGITPALAANYAKKLADMKIDGIEVSCGTSLLSPWNMCRGDIPVKEIAFAYQEPQRTELDARLRKSKMEGKFEVFEGYNVEAAKMIRPFIGNTPLFVVGGWRHVSAMEDAVTNGYTDLISMCRPFIREPSLVKKIRNRKVESASCASCNRCLAALANNMPVKCYFNGFPSLR
jgi:2,4-dienoyl-CoA reductase-like NADH-dependent reductase (Old Yellow Enzyme family)